MYEVSAYGVSGPTDRFQKMTIPRRDPRPNDVKIAIAYVGICHSDLHTARNEWGGTRYPIVPGHEIAGVVEAVGSQVTRFSVGDRVGVGCMVWSCGVCPPCIEGEEQYCLAGFIGTYNGIDEDGDTTQGGYSTGIVVDERFVVAIPPALSLEQAAPLLCAGITTYSPLRHWGIGPGSHVAVVGLGGLGHLAVRLAGALGAEVSVLSQTHAKQDDARALGAEAFYATRDEGTLDRLRGQFDLVVNTVSAPLPLDRYLATLRLNGTFVNVGAPPEPLRMSAFSLVAGRRSLSGSLIGGMRETQEMLEFCAGHGIGATIEMVGGDEIDDAYERMLRGEVRFRFVIDVATI